MRRVRWTPWTVTAAAVATGAWLLAATEPRPGQRIVLPEPGLPAIDQGLFESGAPPAPGGFSWRRVAAPGDEPGRPYAPDRVIVKFRDGVSPQAMAEAAASVGAPSLTRPDSADFHLLGAPAREDLEAVADRLRRLPEVEYAQPAYYWSAYFRPNDPLYDRQWNLSSALDMERAWDVNPGASSSIVVAVLDSGVAYRDAVVRHNARAFRIGSTTYPGLGVIDVPFAAAPDLGAGRFVSPRDFIWESDTPFDLDGHGTHVTGTIGQATNNGQGVAGMAFNVRFMPVKVIRGVWDVVFGAPNAGTDDLVARGIRYAADNGADVINMSIGRNGPPAPAVEDAMRYAVSRGVFIAVAGGNAFERGNPFEAVGDIASRVDGVVAVGAVGRDLRHAYYSSAGSWIEVCAPGGDSRQGTGERLVLQQTYAPLAVDTFLLPPSRFTAPRFDTVAVVGYQGTSMATPHVTGLAALLMQQNITDPVVIEGALKKFATDVGPAGRDDQYGHGLINPRGTLRGLGLTGR